MTLTPKRGGRKSRGDLIDKYRADNEACAKIILRDAARYGGPESGLVVWARLVLGVDTTERLAQNWSVAA